MDHQDEGSVGDRGGTAALASASIVVIDDSVPALRLLVRILGSGGYDVRAEHRAEDALAAIEAEPPDLVLTDLCMPGLDGLHVCSWMHEHHPDIPVIVISGASDSHDRVQGLELGAVDFLTKPFEPKELLARVRTHLSLRRARMKLEAQAAALQRMNEDLRTQVAERRRVARALHESEEKSRGYREQVVDYEAVFANIPSGCAVCDLVYDDAGRPVDYRRMAVNPAYERLTGRSAKEAVGSTGCDIHGEAARARFADLARVAIEGGSISQEWTYAPTGATLHVLAYQTKPGRFVLLLTDVTRQKLMEARLREAERLTAVGHLAAGVAHDFNNQLTAVMGYAEVLASQLADPALKACAENVATASQRLADLTHKLLVFSRQGQYRKEPVRVGALVEEVAATVRQSFDSCIRIHTRLECEPSSDFVLGDPTLLRAALLELAFNSRDAMPDGGTLLFEVEGRRVEGRGDPRLPSLGEGNYVVVNICDTGCGMSEEVQARVFEPFFTTKPRQTGVGMSLPAVYGTVLHHGGGITLDSEVGRGTVFTVYLPRAEAPPKTTREAPAALDGTRARCVLVADDESLIRTLLSKMLSNAGYQVMTATDGQEALDLYREHWESIDLVILDILMPRMDGREAFYAMKALHPDLRVLVASGYSAEEVGHQLLREPGVVGFLPKPFNRVGLLTRVGELLPL